MPVKLREKVERLVVLPRGAGDALTGVEKQPWRDARRAGGDQCLLQIPKGRIARDSASQYVTVGAELIVVKERICDLDGLVEEEGADQPVEVFAGS